MPRRAMSRDGAGRRCARRGTRSRRRQRQHAGHQVEHRALAGAVRADQAQDLAGAHRERQVVDRHQAAEALRDRSNFQQRLARCAGLARRQPGARPAQERAAPSARRQPARERRHEAVAGALQQQHHQHAEHARSRSCRWRRTAVGSTSCSHSFSTVRIEAPMTAPQTWLAPPITAMNRYSMPALTPNGARADEAQEMRVQPARQAGQQRGVEEHDGLQARGVDAEALGHHARGSAARGSRGPSASRAGSRRHQRDQRERPDQVIDARPLSSRMPHERDRRQVGKPGVLAQQLHVAEHEVDRDAPGDRASRQVVARQAQRDRAEEQRHRGHQQQAEQRARARASAAVLGGQHRGGVGGEADERLLAERHHAGDAGQQHQAQR